MKVPYRPTNFRKRKYNFKYIIIHDVNCTFSELSKYMVDDKKSQTNELRTDNYILHNQSDLNFHFLVDFIKDDYETILCRPLTVECNYEDIKSPYDRSLHVGLMGSYTFEIASNRLYRHLGYRCLVPMLGTFGIPLKHILLHKEVSNNKESNCPGDFFRRDKLLTQIKPMLAIKG